MKASPAEGEAVPWQLQLRLVRVLQLAEGWLMPLHPLSWHVIRVLGTAMKGTMTTMTNGIKELLLNTI